MKTILALRFAGLALFTAALTACGGAQSSLPPASAVSMLTVPTGSRQTLGIVNTGSTTSETVTGSVVAMITGGFEIQGGVGLGYLNIHTASSTVFVGARPSAGEQIAAVGSISSNGALNASMVAQGALISVSGPIVALKSNGFQMQGGPGVGYVNVATTAGTHVSGAAPFAGENVKLFGTGSAATSITALEITQTGVTASPSPTAKPTATPTPSPTATPATTTQSGYAQPSAIGFMPSSWGKISAMQVFDDTASGYVTQAAAAADGYRYAAVWGARNNIGTAWLTSNANLQTAYYNALETDESPTSWGAIGHSLTWWQANHPDWVLYACTSSGAVSTNPAWVPGLPNVPLDVHNPSVVNYQVRLMANYAHQLGYRALAIDEATFWQADAGAGSGSYGCGIRQNGTFVRRYSGVTDPAWASDVVAWVKAAHSILTTDPVISGYHLKLIVNHPANQITANEAAFLANVDADLNEDGYTFFGNYIKGSAAYFTRSVNWTTYAQTHGVAVLTDDNWGSVTAGTPQIDWSVATYLMGNEQAEALYAAQANQFGTETWHSQYTANVGAPCGTYYSANDSSNPSIYYRRFANAIVVVNGGSGANSEVAHLPAGHSYADLFGRAVSSSLSIASNDGYVLMTTNGCN